MKLFLISALSVATLMAGSLSQQAKDNGLVAIPNSESALLKLIDNPKNPITPNKVKLGKKLFFDTRLSKSGLISCNFCHNLAEGGDDGIPAARGHKWTQNPHHLNSPTVYNAVFASSQFWDGRNKDVEKQAQGPIQAAPEMAATKKHVVDTVNSMPEYVKEFKKAYGKNVDINFKTIADTIANFERTLVTPSRYDDFLNGYPSALTKAEKKGMKTFIDKGCVTCHNGVALGGSMQAFGIVAPYKYANIGDFKGDKNGLVKVPTLRNISQTAPYFHNGMVSTLKEAIVEMGRIQLGMEITNKEAIEIETFLKALDGRKGHVMMPMLPASTNTTPKPNLN
jgi:cytochrome c peroxidase